MLRRFELTRSELQLIAAVMKSAYFPGLEELSLTAETKIEPSVRDSLVRKGLLKPGKDGRLDLARTVGYIFSGILQEKEYLRGDVLTGDGAGARLNLYFVDDAFMLVIWDGADALECMWIPTIQLAMGALISYVSDPGQLNAAGSAENPPLKALLERVGQPKAAFGFALGDRTFGCAVCESGLFAVKEEKPEPTTVAEFLAPLSREVLRIHQRKILEVTNG